MLNLLQLQGTKRDSGENLVDPNRNIKSFLPLSNYDSWTGLDDFLLPYEHSETDSRSRFLLDDSEKRNLSFTSHLSEVKPRVPTMAEGLPTLTSLVFSDWNMSFWDVYNVSNGSVSDDDDGSLDVVQTTVTAAILGSICLMTIGGNILVLLAVFVNSHLRGTTHYFIANLALADLLLGTTVLPFSVTLEVLNYWVFGELLCDIWAAIDVLCCTASILSLCVISIDRYIGVTRPLQHSRILTERRAVGIILIVWLLSLIISIAPLLGWKSPSMEVTGECEVNKDLGYVLFSVACSFYIPLVIIILVYYRVYREAVTQSRFLATGTKHANEKDSKGVTLRIHTGRMGSSVSDKKYSVTSQTSGHQPVSGRSSAEIGQHASHRKTNRFNLSGRVAKFKLEKKAAKTLGIVVGVFILCWFPFFFILPLGALCESCQIPDALFTVFFWLGYCNSMMNPIIYALSSREFKRAFIRILKCDIRRRPRSFVIDDQSRSGRSERRNVTRVLSSIRAISKSIKRREIVNTPSQMTQPYKTQVSTLLYRERPDEGVIRQQLLTSESPMCSAGQVDDRCERQERNVVVVSDDESATLGHSDKSDPETETIVISFPRRADNGQSDKQLDNCYQLHEQTLNQGNNRHFERGIENDTPTEVLNKQTSHVKSDSVDEERLDVLSDPSLPGDFSL